MHPLLRKIRKTLSGNVINIPGRTSSRKIVVIESDDWGSLRMPSPEVAAKLAKMGMDVITNPLNRYDNLESNDDLTATFEVLNRFRDKAGNPPVITANFVMGNPHFDKIKASDYTQYHFEPFTDSYQRYPNHDKAFSIVKEGIANKLFWPQFHGKEHLNVELWMQELKKKTPEFMTAFDLGVFGIDLFGYFARRTNLMAALDFNDQASRDQLKAILTEGMQIFERLFGFSSKSFIAPCFVWDETAEQVLNELGVKYLQGGLLQFKPVLGRPKFKKEFHYMGEKNSLGQLHLIRNCNFELATNNNYPWVNACLNNMANAFRWHKPAIITTHRFNFIGSLDESNRARTLEQTGILLTAMLKKWPDIEFMTSDQLGNLMLSE